MIVFYAEQSSLSLHLVYGPAPRKAFFKTFRSPFHCFLSFSALSFLHRAKIVFATDSIFYGLPAVWVKLHACTACSAEAMLLLQFFENLIPICKVRHLRLFSTFA